MIDLDNRRQVDTFILDFEKAFDTPLMNSLKANCLAMESVARHFSFALDNELL